MDQSTKNTLYEIEMQDQAQIKMERKQREAKAKGRESTVHPYNGLVSLMIVKSEEILKARLRKTRKKGRPHVGTMALRESGLPIRTICSIAARTVVDGVSARRRLQNITMKIGGRIEDEIRMIDFKKREPLLYQWMQTRLKERKSDDYSHKRQVFMGAMKRANSEETWTAWDAKTRVGVGLLLIDVLMTAGFVEKVALPADAKGRIEYYLLLTAEVEAGLSAADAKALDLLKPWFKPMLVIPADWTGPDNGGYYTVDLPIMKTTRKQDIERLRGADMGTVYAAVNALQRTPWRINQDVLVVAEELREAGAVIEGLPTYTELSKPIRPNLPPIGDDLNDEEKVLLSKFKGEQRAWFNAEAKRRSKTTQSLQILEIADELRDEVFYFPHQLDYRGRAYAVPLQLNPQSNDFAKGLLCFGEAKPVGVMGGYWIAVHGANLWGVDKGKLNDRVDWVLEHEDEIRAVAEDPISNQWWTEADGGKTPWRFLAFCLEWTAYLDSGESPDFESRLPVSVDGSCNGLQHFSAMLRDPVGALVTNLTSCPEQQDVYQDVADRTDNLIRASRNSSAVDTEMAGVWLKYGIKRATVKRPVMTTPYGVTKIGMKQMVLDDVIAPDKTGAYFGEKTWESAAWLAEKIDEAIGQTVSSAKEAMSFLQGLARAAAADGQFLTWTTPAGFPVVQRLCKSTQFLIKTSLLGYIQLRFSEQNDTLDKRRQVSSIAPNFVHSYDAAHLMLTVVAMEEQEGPQAWAMVHDSYGTHAGSLHALGRVLREQFVLMYQDHDPLGDLLHRLEQSVPTGTDLPKAPTTGDFDLNEVLDAEFFFA